MRNFISYANERAWDDYGTPYYEDCREDQRAEIRSQYQDYESRYWAHQRQLEEAERFEREINERPKRMVGRQKKRHRRQ